MTYYKEVVLANGKSCILRNPRKEDAKQILELMKVTSDETNHMLRYCDEVVMSEEKEALLLEDIKNSNNSGMICAQIDGEIVANGGVNPSERFDRCLHRASFGISVKKAFWGLSIGTMILSGIIEKAKEAGYEFLELDVVSHNERGINLYKKMGFKQYGYMEKAFKYRDGSYADTILMRLKLCDN